MKEFDDLKAAVQRAETVQASAVTLLQGTASAILANKDDPAAIEALANELNASADTLAAAVSANTPAAAPPADPSDSSATAAPIAVLTTDPNSGASSIITQHPDGTVLSTPVVSTDLPPTASVTVDPDTGVPSVVNGGAVTLGSTDPAPDGTPAPDEHVAAGTGTDVTASADGGGGGDGQLQ